MQLAPILGKVWCQLYPLSRDEWYYFFWSPSFEPIVTDAGVIHHNDNMSDHAPIYCSIDFHCNDKLPDLDPGSSPLALKPSWKRATAEQKKAFPTILNEKLSLISISEIVQNCSNVKCRDPEHINEADKFISDILECVESAATEALPIPPPPRTLPSKRKLVPGWKSEVKPFRDTAYFWHQVWVSAGKPMNT